MANNQVPTVRGSALSLANACSFGFRASNYGGRSTGGAARLDMITMSPARRVSASTGTNVVMSLTVLHR